MTALTSKQKELLQKDKYELDDMLVQKDNELDLCLEANIKAQEEIDGKIKPKEMTNEQQVNLVDALNKSIGLDGMNHQLQQKIDKIESLLDKVWDGTINDRDFKLEVTSILCTEEGTSGTI